MAADPTSPVTPASVRVLLVPIGRVRRRRFRDFVERLESEAIVRLGDITPDAQKTAFSPLAFPNGFILYNFSTTLPATTHIALSPFETFRRPLVVICIGDGVDPSSSNTADVENHFDYLKTGMAKAREAFPDALAVQLLLFEYPTTSLTSVLPNGTIIVPKPEESRSNTMKTVMADISSTFLAELSALARFFHATPPLELLHDAEQGYPGLAASSTTSRNSTHRVEHPHNGFSIPGAMIGEITEDSNGINYETKPMADRGEDSIQSTPPMHGGDSPSRFSMSSRAPTVDGHRYSGFEYDQRADSVDSEKPSLTGQKSSQRNSHGNVADFGSSRLKARQAIIMGSLYLQSGRWADAIRESVDGATRAKMLNDYPWQAKGLENILTTMLLLASARFDFQIPEICVANPPKTIYGKRASRGSFVGFGDIRPSMDPTNAAAVQRLSSVIPELCQLIVNVYARAANARGEVPYHFAFSECVIRLAKLLSIHHLSGGIMTRDTLRDIVRGRPVVSLRKASASVVKKAFQSQLSAFLFRAYPPQPTSAQALAVDGLIILSGMASVLSFAGLKRKQAIINKELLSLLSTALIGAGGAVASGDHNGATPGVLFLQALAPDSTALHTRDVNSSLRELLKLVCHAYGVTDRVTVPATSTSNGPDRNIIEITVPDIVDGSAARSYGSDQMRNDILHLCFSISEAVPDLKAVIQYATALLYAGGLNLAPANPTMTRLGLLKSEQIQLSSKISQVLALAEPATVSSLEARYWDSFMVRGFVHCAARKEYALMSRSKSDFTTIAARRPSHSQVKGFLHDALSTASMDLAVDRTLVAGENSEFTVTLQNLYDFSVVVEDFQLSTEGVSIEQVPMSFTLKPRQVQRVTLNVLVTSAGNLRVQGCVVKIKGCVEQLFFIFDKPWKAKRPLKIKDQTSSKIGDSSDSTLLEEMAPPRPLTPSFTVARPQPLLSILSTSLAQSIIRVLLGETFSISITVKNMSKYVSVDFVHISFSQPTANSASPPRELSEVELYDAEYEICHLPTFRWRTVQGVESTVIEPGMSTSFDIEVVGKQDVSEFVVVIDYACLNCSLDSVKDKFSTRRVTLPLTIAVKPSIEIERIDMVSLKDPPSSHTRQSAAQSTSDPLVAGQDVEQDANEDDFFLVVDFRNSWLRPLEVSLQQFHDTAAANGDEKQSLARNVGETIQPDAVVRLAIQLPRVTREHFSQPIPILNSASRKQYIVDQAHKSSEVESAMRQAFWCREGILNSLKASWKECTKDNSGTIDLRSMHVSQRVVNIVAQDHIKVQMELGYSVDEGDTLKGHGSHFTSQMDRFLTLKIHLHNQSEEELRPLLQISSRLRQDAVDDAKNLVAWTGALQRSGWRLGPRESVDYSLGVCFLAAGDYVISAIVDSLRHTATRRQSDESATSELGRAVCDMHVTDSGEE